MSQIGTRAVIKHPHSNLDARHTIEQIGDEVEVSESWHDDNGDVIQRYAVRMLLSLLVHVALNTTADERAEIDARADWRGVP